jgi:hypothetical protein
MKWTGRAAAAKLKTAEKAELLARWRATMGDLCISGDASPVVVPHAFARATSEFQLARSVRWGGAATLVDAISLEQTHCCGGRVVIRRPAARPLA